MKFFIDTANLEEIRKAKEYGLIDGVTTNPTLLAREGADWKKQMELICKEVDGPVSLEVIGLKADGMIEEARELVKYGPNVVVKIPMTMEGMKAVRHLADMGVRTNVTVCFSAAQALLAAKAGAAYISPFIGRLDHLSQRGMDLVEEIVAIYGNYDFETEVLVASIRHPLHVVEAALAGADVATVPFKVLFDLAKHPMTDLGIESFLTDWKKVFPDG
ncbi:transaldolase [Alkalidesulfovibrio alkalitolerans DSM 16529]|jgi:transaldolase|uniref:Probable transaldolase n=1 Tax=Alkalidesulfovibrio alkalitolerans DSM 16529 TaxID=1121439 RepID=S7T1M7_9BACT|nr:fructose-6-phosphate aldolase [Alkalidesulfovibrio alkalitolerans]EPR30405.1 transaldolase [Alkalidesulfovibrio alkalitolerans DSM 16529]